ncbi:MAG: crossover junction endodeoxyribonuclease RuvC [Planctomycetota bacterium]
MRVLGIDPGLLCTGYAYLDVPNPASLDGITIVESGCFVFRKNASIPSRLLELEHDLRELIDRLNPGIACVETLFAHPAYPKAALTVAHARGVALMTLQRFGVEIEELPPAEIKRALTGSGRASKQQMQRSAAALLKLPAIPEPADVADAMAIALAGARRSNITTA